jgi:hypothetical protein
MTRKERWAGESYLFYELALEIMWHQFYSILFIRRKLLSIAHIQGEGELGSIFAK